MTMPPSKCWMPTRLSSHRVADGPPGDRTSGANVSLLLEQAELFALRNRATRAGGVGTALTTNTTVASAVPGTGLTLYRNLTPQPFIKRTSTSQEEQLCFDLDDQPSAVRLISPSHCVFMSMRVLSYFARDKELHRAAQELVRQDLLYLAEIAMLSRMRLRHKLGRFAHCAAAIEREIEKTGIALNARAPWW